MDSVDIKLIILVASVPIVYEMWKFIASKFGKVEINETIFPRSKTIPIYQSQLFKLMNFREDSSVLRSQEILVKLFAEAVKTIDVAVYHISKKELCFALIKAKKRGVEVRVIVDGSSEGLRAVKDCIDKIMRPVEIPVRIYRESMMHIKMCLIDVPDKDDSIVQLVAGSPKSRLPANGLTITGSMNWSREGMAANEEMFVVTSNKNICQVSKVEFEQLWNDSDM